MADVSLRALLDDAAELGYAIPAFNINSFEQGHAVMLAAQAENAPAIIQATALTQAYFGEVVLARLLDGLRASYPEVPTCVHLDHGMSKATCLAAIRHGFTSVMIDGSVTPDLRRPSEFEENVRVTTEVVQCMHSKGVAVEGALGVVGSLASCLGISEDGNTTVEALPRAALVTDPPRAREFVDRTGVDALAVAIGTTHGVSKFESAPAESSFELRALEAIHDRLPNTHLVMHGCSSLSPELQQMLDVHGGSAALGWGVPVALLKKAIGRGVRKINIDTDNRLAMTAGIRRFLSEFPMEIDPRRYLEAGRIQVTELCRGRYRDFGASGRASRILARWSRGKAMSA